MPTPRAVDIADTRTPRQIADVLRDRHGLEPVWKDWEEAITETLAAG